MEKSTVVKGAYFDQKIRRTITEEVMGQSTSQVKTFDAVTGAKITKLAGEGISDRFSEEYVTLEGHYAPGKFVRLTGFSQNSKALRDLFQGFQDGKYISVNAVGDPMSGYGMNVREAEALTPDGQRVVIIADPNAKPVAQSASL